MRLTSTYTGVNWGRDLPEPDLVADIRNVLARRSFTRWSGASSRSSAASKSAMSSTSAPSTARSMNATYLDESGKPQLMEMGCYGIGVTRILGAAIEQGQRCSAASSGRMAIAPFSVVLCATRLWSAVPTSNPPPIETARRPGDALGVDVLLDDRGERPGAMFADWELIGVPLRVVISDRGLKAGTVEVQGAARCGRRRAVAVDEVLEAT